MVWHGCTDDLRLAGRWKIWNWNQINKGRQSEITQFDFLFFNYPREPWFYDHLINRSTDKAHKSQQISDFLHPAHAVCFHLLCLSVLTSPTDLPLPPSGTIDIMVVCYVIIRVVSSILDRFFNDEISRISRSQKLCSLRTHTTRSPVHIWNQTCMYMYVILCTVGLHVYCDYLI